MCKRYSKIPFWAYEKYDYITYWNASEEENIGRSRCRWASSIEVERTDTYSGHFPFWLKKQNILETGSASITK
jgi:hypothetical protein